ncbi:MAG TPA: DNA polymerase III subunit delta [Vicinamibacterales bacterium]|nr:DNA polymerase III subunit delta [Vicinamibacterales bacterium]
MLVGADDAEKAAVAGEFADVIDEGLQAFNVERMYGGETKVDRLIDAAQTLPMMAPRRIVIILEAEKLLMPKKESKAAEEEQQRLEAFIESPPDHATVVFVCGPLDMRRRVPKLLAKQAQVVDCGTIENEADADLWVKTRAARDKITLDPAAVRALVERAGLDIVRLRSGLERVALYAMGQPKITVDDVRQVVSAGPQAEEDFGIANAIRTGDAPEALRQLGASLDAGGIPFVLMGQLRWVAEKMPPQRVRPAVEAVFRTDLALKSSGGDPRILLERLVVELCGSAPGGRAVSGSSARTWQGPRYRK